MSNSNNEKPVYEVVQLKDGSAYFVRVTWSDGFEQQINGFADAAEALEWIDTNGPCWHEWATHRVQPKR
jgi:hypothetical protein